jgi:hypothetical protein
MTTKTTETKQKTTYIPPAPELQVAWEIVRDFNPEVGPKQAEQLRRLHVDIVNGKRPDLADRVEEIRARDEAIRAAEEDEDGWAVVPKGTPEMQVAHDIVTAFNPKFGARQCTQFRLLHADIVEGRRPDLADRVEQVRARDEAAKRAEDDVLVRVAHELSAEGTTTDGVFTRRLVAMADEVLRGRPHFDPRNNSGYDDYWLALERAKKLGEPHFGAERAAVIVVAMSEMAQQIWTNESEDAAFDGLLVA